MPDVNPYEFNEEPVQLEDQIQFLNNILKIGIEVKFSLIIKSLTNRLEIVVIFRAILELVKNSQILISQEKPFDDLFINRIVA